jgi:hypothetical protein
VETLNGRHAGIVRGVTPINGFAVLSAGQFRQTTDAGNFGDVADRARLLNTVEAALRADRWTESNAGIAPPRRADRMKRRSAISTPYSAATARHALLGPGRPRNEWSGAAALADLHHLVLC